MEQLTARVFDFARKQCLLMEKQLPADKTPRTYTPQGIFVPTKLSWWCSGFYPGVLWMVYEKTGDGTLKEYAVSNCHKIDDVDAPLTYADYYFMEALLRYENR